MKYFIVLTILFFCCLTTSNAQPVAPVPGCACNNIASQFSLNRKEEQQTQKEIKKMDEEANRLEEPVSNSAIPKKTKYIHRWFWQK